MRCEICGKKVVGRPFRVKIEGSIMQTCKECSKFGKIQKEPPKPVKRSTPRRIHYREPTNEVLEDYNNVIRLAREKLGWSRENLGEKVNEKVSVISRIEMGRMVPDIKLAKKLEKILGVTLIEEVENENLDDKDHHRFKGATIGDVAFIKRNK